MKPSLDVENFPLWCEGCNRQGYIFIRSPEDDHFIVCEACGWETSFVTCHTAGVGGMLVRNIEEHPDTWECVDCGSTHKLPEDFYSKPARIYFVEELPEEVRAKIAPGKSPARVVVERVILVGMGVIIWLMLYAVLDQSKTWLHPFLFFGAAVMFLAAGSKSAVMSPQMRVRLLALAGMGISLVPGVYRIAVPSGPIRMVDMICITLFVGLNGLTVVMSQSSPPPPAKDRSPTGT